MLLSVLLYSAPPRNFTVACSMRNKKELTLFWSFMNIFKYVHTFTKLRHYGHYNKLTMNTIIFLKKCVSYYIRHYLKRDNSSHQWRKTAKFLCLYLSPYSFSFSPNMCEWLYVYMNVVISIPVYVYKPAICLWGYILLSLVFTLNSFE